MYQNFENHFESVAGTHTYSSNTCIVNNTQNNNQNNNEDRN